MPDSGVVLIDTAFGITVTGPAGFLSVDSLVLGAGLGRTTLELQTGSIVAVAGDLNLADSGAIAGQGTLACLSTIGNAGLITLDNLDLLAAGLVTNEATGRVDAIDAYVDADMTNQGDINVDAFTSGVAHSILEITGALDNQTSGQVFVTGDATMYLDGGLTNSGSASFTSTQAILHGAITNAGTDDGMGGFTPLGVISGSSASDLVFIGDVVNQSNIVLATDSTITLLGSLSGNGVTGPGGGAGGAVFIEGDFNPGFALATTVASFGGDVNLGSGATTTVRIGGTILGAELDQVATLANLSLGGTLVVNLINGYVPQPGDVYHVLDFATASGSFSSIVLDQSLVDAGADTSSLLIDGTIVVAPPICVGDIDGDNDTDVFDFAVFAANFGMAVTAGTNGDLDGNGAVNVLDFAIFAPDFGCPN